MLWSQELTQSFEQAQKFLSSSKCITLSRTTDQLWIVIDASIKALGLTATLYTMRQDKLFLAGHFSAKLRTHQRSWLPCELEVLTITIVTNHFSPYIIQSHLQACVLTDSKPCVEAIEKLCRGEFSTSRRVATFLSTISRYQVSVRHLTGTSNCPSDFGSRNVPACTEEHCQVCAFIQVQQDATVCQARIDDILSGAVCLPFSS